jgi:RND family efflux transporter MFP subunit
MVVAAGDRPVVRSFAGRVEASKNADLAFQVSGVLISLPIREGERAAKGTTIAQLRQDEFQARLKTVQAQFDQARSQLQAVETRLANTKTEFDRFARLVGTSAVSRSEYDAAETAYRVAQDEQKSQEASVRGLEGRLTEVTLQLGDSTLRAPYDGVVAQRLVEVGQNVTANSPAIRFQNVDEIDIVVDVPESFMAAESRRSDIVQSVAEFGMAPGRQFPVTIREITQVADPKTQIFQVRFTMKAPPGITALPGMTASVVITTRGAGAAGNRVLVPVSAVSKQETGEQVVWVLGPDKVVHGRKVKLGAPTDDLIVIEEGLQPGDRIVVAGAPFMRDGMKVRDLGDALGGGQ